MVTKTTRKAISVLAAAVLILASGCATVPPKMTTYGWPIINALPEYTHHSLVLEVGNYEHCRDIWQWPSWKLGDCNMYEGKLRVRAASEDANGRQVPRFDTLGHEMWHLHAWGGDWHK